jgi:hypothetical protein
MKSLPFFSRDASLSGNDPLLTAELATAQDQDKEAASFTDVPPNYSGTSGYTFPALPSECDKQHSHVLLCDESDFSHDDRYYIKRRVHSPSCVSKSKGKRARAAQEKRERDISNHPIGPACMPQCRRSCLQVIDQHSACRSMQISGLFHTQTKNDGSAKDWREQHQTGANMTPFVPVSEVSAFQGVNTSQTFYLVTSCYRCFI